MIKPKPTQLESHFDFNEFFFSTTDLRGVIISGNDVFTRISGYAKEVLKNAPHSIIRHPDMPRAVFKLLWDTLKSGAPIAAYVKNMSANGNYYWVLAFVFPIENGYLSIRFKPSSALFKAAQGLYPMTLAVEETSGMEGSVPFLLDQVKKAGFSDYQDFMIQAAFAEINILEEKNKNIRNDNQSEAASKISEICFNSSEKLKDFFHRVQKFHAINQSFIAEIQGLDAEFQHLKIIALNMTIAAAKFGGHAAGLTVVAKEFSGLAEQIKDHLMALSEFVATLTAVVQKCALRIVGLNTQMLMVDFFVRESLQKFDASESAFEEMIENRENFSRLFREYSEGLKDEIQSLKVHLDGISRKMGEVSKFTTGLEVIRQIGAVESSRMSETRQSFQHYLEEMQKFIFLLQASSSSIQKELEELTSSRNVISVAVSSLGGLVDSIFELAANYSKNGTGKAKAPLVHRNGVTL
jgi:aerotaxis receptor